MPYRTAHNHLGYVKGTYFFFPLKSGTKHPLLGGDWRNHSTDDPAVIQGWLDAGHNLGLDCGKSDVLVVDLDPGSVRPDLPPTFERTTPRGGSHVFFRGCQGLTNTAGKLGPHIDTRGRGGYVVWDGWTPDGAYGPGNGLAVEPTPAWLFARLQPADTATKAIHTEATPSDIARAREWMRQRNPPTEGQTFNTFLGLLDLVDDDDAILDIAMEHWPTWNREEAEAKLANARAYRKNDPGALAAGSAAERFAHSGLATAAEVKPFRVHDEADQDDWQEPTWLVPHALPDDSLVMLYGAKGSFKSFIALDLGLHIASARPGWGASFEERQAVVYCAGEGPTSVGKFRRPAWRSAYPDIHGPLPFFLVKDAEFPKAISGESVRNFIEGVRHLNPALVIIDTLHVFMTGLSEVKDDDCGIAIESLKQIKRELGCIVLVIHHAGKDSTAGARGHSSLTADMDVVHEAIGHPATKALALWNRYQKDADERQAPWCFEGKSVGRSLVFQPITEQQHRELTTAGAELSERDVIGPALATAGAKGHERALTSYQLAAILYQGPADEDPAASVRNKDRLAKQLSARAKHSVFAEKTEHGWVWSVPA